MFYFNPEKPLTVLHLQLHLEFRPKLLQNVKLVQKRMNIVQH